MSLEETKKLKRVGVLRGWSGLPAGRQRKNYETSLKKGGEIITFIFENLSDKYKVYDILVDKDYIWHMNGMPVSPSDLVDKVDIIWNTVHASLANILDSLSIPNVSISFFSGAMENSKDLLKEHLKGIDIKIPRSVVLPLYQKDFDGPKEKYAMKKAKEIFERFGAPWVVKSYTEDRDVGIHLAKTFPELVSAIEDGVNHEKSILVEEFISGKIASLHSIPGFRMNDSSKEKGELYTFPFGNTFGVFLEEEKNKLKEMAQKLHKHIGAKHYLKSVFVLNPQGKVYLLQIETMPDLKHGSHLSEVAESIGAKMHHIVEHILENARI